MIHRIIQVYIAYLLVVFCSSYILAEQHNHSQKFETSKAPASQPHTTKFEVVTTPNAPSGINRSIKQDKEGDLLIAAFRDIIRYDGQSFKKLNRLDGLDSYDAFDVLEDTKGNIWIASTHKGVFRYNGKVLSNFTTKNGLAHDRVMSIFEDKTGIIWVATKGGLSFYDGNFQSKEHVTFQSITIKDGLTSNDINTIMEDKTGRLWIGTRGTLSVYELSMPPNSDTRSFFEMKDSEGKPFTNVWSIIEDQKGNIWLGDSRGIWRFKNNTFTYYPETSGNARLYEDKKGNIWFTQVGELSYYAQASLLSKNPKAIQVHISDSMLFGLSEDKDGNIWVGTLNGVLRYDGESISYFKDSLAKD